MSDSSSYHLHDSGRRQEFDTGSRRDTRDGKGRYDLMPTLPLRLMAQLYEAGAKKYGDRNWEKGQPLSRYLDSAFRHLVSWLAGDRSEQHLIQCAWNCWSYVQTEAWIREGRLPAHLNDVDFTHGKTKLYEYALGDHGVRGSDGRFHKMAYLVDHERNPPHGEVVHRLCLDHDDCDEHDDGLHAPRPGHPDLL